MSPEQEKFLDDNFSQAVSNFREERKSIGRAIFYISTGAFVLSISFLSTVSDIPFTWPWLLIAAWFFLAASIVCYLISSYLKALAEGEVMDEINSKRTAAPLPHGYNPGDTPKVNRLVLLAHRFNIATYFFLAFGIIALLFFVSVNFLAKQAVEGQFGDTYRAYLTGYQNQMQVKLPDTGFQPH